MLETATSAGNRPAGTLRLTVLVNVSRQDDVFRRLSACHNVLFPGHQAFLTEEALTHIGQTTLQNIQLLARGEECPNLISA